MSGTAAVPTETAVRATLATIPDPELPVVSIVDLGMIHRVTVDDSGIRVAVLPFGRPGVISASMLALGRALGETIAVTFLVSKLADNTPWTFSLFNGGETFASRIANNAAEFDTPAKTGAYIAAGLVLFVLTFVVNAIARIVIERRKAFSE